MIIKDTWMPMKNCSFGGKAAWWN